MSQDIITKLRDDNPFTIDDVCGEDGEPIEFQFRESSIGLIYRAARKNEALTGEVLDLLAQYANELHGVSEADDDLEKIDQTIYYRTRDIALYLRTNPNATSEDVEYIVNTVQPLINDHKYTLQYTTDNGRTRITEEKFAFNPVIDLLKIMDNDTERAGQVLQFMTDHLGNLTGFADGPQLQKKFLGRRFSLILDYLTVHPNAETDELYQEIILNDTRNARRRLAIADPLNPEDQFYHTKRYGEPHARQVLI